eukprot:6168444-Ditylum_brightwellii.AAC.1
MEQSKAAKALKKTCFSPTSKHISSAKNKTKDDFPADADITSICNTVNPPTHDKSSQDNTENLEGSTNSNNNYFQNVSNPDNRNKDDETASSTTDASNQPGTVTFSSLRLQFPTYLKNQVIAKPLPYT